MARLERDHMYGYFAIRRLIECRKLSSDTMKLDVRVKQHLFRAGSRISLFNRSDLDSHYDLERSVSTTMPIRELTNQVIHSYVFMLLLQRGSCLAGVCVTSEHQRRRSLAWVPAWRTVRLFRRVADDWPVDVRMKWDEKTGDYVYHAWRKMR